MMNAFIHQATTPLLEITTKTATKPLDVHAQWTQKTKVIFMENTYRNIATICMMAELQPCESFQSHFTDSRVVKKTGTMSRILL